MVSRLTDTKSGKWLFMLGGDIICSECMSVVATSLRAPAFKLPTTCYACGAHMANGEHDYNSKVKSVFDSLEKEFGKDGDVPKQTEAKEGE